MKTEYENAIKFLSQEPNHENYYALVGVEDVVAIGELWDTTDFTAAHLVQRDNSVGYISTSTLKGLIEAGHVVCYDVQVMPDRRAYRYYRLRAQGE